MELTDLWQMNWSDLSRNLVPVFDRHWAGDLNRGLNINELKSSKQSRSNSGYQTNGHGSNGHNNGYSPVKTSIQSNQPPTKKKEPGVFITIVKCFGFNYFIGFMLRTTTDLMMFVSPLILNLLIQFVESDEPLWKGIMYATLLFCNAFVGTLFNANGIHNFYMSGMRAKTCLISAVYRKSLLLSNSAKRAESAGEIVNHMAVDVNYATEFAQVISQFTQYRHE